MWAILRAIKSWLCFIGHGVGIDGSWCSLHALEIDFDDSFKWCNFLAPYDLLAVQYADACLVSMWLCLTPAFPNPSFSLINGTLYTRTGFKICDYRICDYRFVMCALRIVTWFMTVFNMCTCWYYVVGLL